jgi:hypothetical protein
MKLALSILLATLTGSCVIKERVRVEYRQLPPKTIEKVYLIIPKPPAGPPKLEPGRSDDFA